MTCRAEERHWRFVRGALAPLMLLGIGLLAACAPVPEQPPTPQEPPPPKLVPTDSALPLAIKLAEETLSRLHSDHVVPNPAGELQARFIRQLTDRLSEGPWREPLPAAEQALAARITALHRQAPETPILPAVETALAAVVRDLGSRSAYLDQDTSRFLRREGEATSATPGIRIMQINGTLRINDVIADSPAERAGLGRGDKLIAVGGWSTAGAVPEEVAARLRGAPGSQVAVLVEFDNGEQRLINLRREPLAPNTIEGRWLSRGIAYIRVSALDAQSVEDFNQVFLKLLHRVGAPRGLILDLRDNTGGLLDVAVRLTDIFLAEGTILEVRGRAGKDAIRMVASPGAGVMEQKLPLAVLINGHSASGAEAIAAALQDHRRAVVVGTRSMGVGVVHTMFLLPGERTLKLATGTLYRASGEKLDERGVLPDLCVVRNTSRVVSRADVAGATATACPYREAEPAARGDEDTPLAVAFELLADRARYRQVLERAVAGKSSAR